MATKVKRARAAEARALDSLAAAVAGLADAATVRRLLDELLTPGELHDLSLRWRLLQQLQAGVPQRAIAAEHGISLCKITRGSRVLKQPGSVVAGLLPPAPPPQQT